MEQVTHPRLCLETTTVFILALLQSGQQFDSLPKLDALQDYWNRLSERPARLRAAAMDAALLTDG